MMRRGEIASRYRQETDLFRLDVLASARPHGANKHLDFDLCLSLDQVRLSEQVAVDAHLEFVHQEVD